MSTTQNIIVRVNGDDMLRWYFTLRELSEFVAAAHAAGAQPDDSLNLSRGLQIEIPNAEQRAENARMRALYEERR